MWGSSYNTLACLLLQLKFDPKDKFSFRASWPGHQLILKSPLQVFSMISKYEYATGPCMITLWSISQCVMIPTSQFRLSMLIGKCTITKSKRIRLPSVKNILSWVSVLSRELDSMALYTPSDGIILWFTFIWTYMQQSKWFADPPWSQPLIVLENSTWSDRVYDHPENSTNVHGNPSKASFHNLPLNTVGSQLKNRSKTHQDIWCRSNIHGHAPYWFAEIILFSVFI